MIQRHSNFSLPDWAQNFGGGLLLQQQALQQALSKSSGGLSAGAIAGIIFGIIAITIVTIIIIKKSKNK